MKKKIEHSEKAPAIKHENHEIDLSADLDFLTTVAVRLRDSEAVKSDNDKQHIEMLIDRIRQITEKTKNGHSAVSSSKE